MAKFIANNNILASNKLSLFFIIKGLYSYINFNMVELSDTSTYEQIFK